MGVSKGYKLSEIDKNNIEKSGFSDKNNLIIKFKNNSEWFFVFNKDGTKINESEAKRRASIILKEFAGNEDVLRFIVAQLPENSKDNSD
jgi:hypothetical protein